MYRFLAPFWDFFAFFCTKLRKNFRKGDKITLNFKKSLAKGGARVLQ